MADAERMRCDMDSGRVKWCDSVMARDRARAGACALSNHGALPGPHTHTQPTNERKPKPEPEPIDLSQVNTADNQFIWIALVGVILTLGGLFWFS